MQLVNSSFVQLLIVTKFCFDSCNKRLLTDLGSGDGSSKAAEVVANQVQVEKGAGDEPSPTKLEQKPKVQM